MRIEFSQKGFADFRYWAETDRKILKRILALLESIESTPFKGLGQPEPLRHDYAGYWSRRIDEEHRLIYRVYGKDGDNKEPQRCLIAPCRWHYRES